MLKIIQAPSAIQANKSFAITGSAEPTQAGKNLVVTVDNHFKITGPSVKVDGVWRIHIAFGKLGEHRLEIALDNEKIDLFIKVFHNGSSQSSGDIVAFYLGEEADTHGRIIEDIWMWDYAKLEYTHNYIQWLFPLIEKSRFNPTAPVLTDEIIDAFQSNDQLRNRLLKSLKVMLKFYGMKCVKVNGDVEITKSEEYLERKKQWISSKNHNYLRLTRILHSLVILGLNKHAQALFKCLNRIYQEEGQKIGGETYNYWKNTIFE